MALLYPMTDRAELRRAVDVLKTNLKRGSRLFRKHWVGYPGGSGPEDLYWNSNFWFAIKEIHDDPKHWMIYGTEDPRSKNMVSISVEINSPLSGTDKRVAGCFVRDEYGTVYLAHSGKVGGGTKGVGKNAFVDFFRAGNWSDVQWTDGSNHRMNILGVIDDHAIRTSIYDFVKVVDKFKKAVRGSTIPNDETKGIPPVSPGFSGRKTYGVAATIVVNSIHGDIVSALDVELKKRGYKTTSDINRDLYAYGRRHILFEIKPECTTDSIYKAIGQLMFLGVDDQNSPVRVAVFPALTTRATRKKMSKIGIKLLRFKSRAGHISFPDLGSVMRSIES